MSPVHALLVLAAALGGEPAGEVIDFSATYCGPCRTMTPIVARLEREGLPIRQVDIEQDRALADRFHISKIPTFVLVINGEEATRIVGPTTEAELRRLCARIPQATAAVSAAPAVQLASNPPQSREGVSQPLGTEAPAEEQKPNRILEAIGFRRRQEQPAKVRANNDEMPAAGDPAMAAAANDPMASSVRIRATINGQISLGSGTIVHSEPGRTMIVTCGHIFKNIDDSSKVEVDLFVGDKPQTFVASIVDFDLQADVGVICIPTHNVVPTTPLAPATLALAKAERVRCIGCSSGNGPTREQLTITAVNKYDGPDNIECTGTPVQGRSGGGLFNKDNQLVGVCIAAVLDEQLGVYAHVFAVHKLLDKNNLAHLYQPATPAVEETPEAFVAEAAPAEMPADFPAETAVDVAQPPAQTAELAAATEPPVSEVTDLASAMSDIPAGDAEVVVIIRSRSQPEQSRVVIINRASPKLLAFLDGKLRPEGLAANRPAPTTRASAEPKSRGQLTATARGPQAATQTTAFQPSRSDSRAPSRRLTEGRRVSATAAK